MPTLHFLVYLLLIALAYLFRLSYLGWFGPLFFWAVITVPLLLLLLSLPSMRGLTIRLKAPAAVTRGNAGALEIRFETARFLPLSKVKLWVEADNRFAGESRREHYTLRSLGASGLEIPLHSELCGLQILRVTRWECRDILGLIAIRKQLPASVKCTVLPLPEEPEKLIDIDAALDTASVFKPKYGGGFSEEHDLREYRPGDTVNSIHWKLSSKTDDVIVREPLEQENNRIYLVLSRVGADDRGLSVLYWLSLELCRRELAHIIVSNALYSVGNEAEATAAMTGILSTPITEPCRFDASDARCIFRISAGEVLRQ